MAAKIKPKKKPKETVATYLPHVSNANVEDTNDDLQWENEEAPMIIQDVERRFSAIRAMRDVEIGHTLTGLRLLRSYFDEKQLQTNVVDFSKENMPNMLILKNEDNGEYEAQWKSRDGSFSMDHGDGIDVHSSILHRMSKVHQSNCTNTPAFDGFDFSSKVNTSFFGGADNLQFMEFLMEGPPDCQMLGKRKQDGFKTPGLEVSSQRLSVGMTPKTRRLPKPGEILLSVHGSPLGVYKDDNMEAIHESEEV